MNVIAEENWAWMLYEEGNDRFLSVLCGTVGIYELHIQLEAIEIESYQRLGLRYIDQLAQAVTGNPTVFLARNLNDFANRQAVQSATERWRNRA